MKILSISNSLKYSANKNSFRGTTKYFGYDSNRYLKIQDTPSDLGKNLYDNFTHQLEYLSPKFATVRNAFDLRKGRTGKIYFGDPDEKIDFNKVFKDHDYAVSDMEPHYPNIDKVSAGYFHTDNTKYDEHFQEIADFHNRREAAAKKFEAQFRKNLFDGINKEDSKEKIDYYVWQQQDSFEKRRQALEALEIYNKAKDLKAVKEENGRKLNLAYSYEGYTKNNVESAIKSLENAKKTITERQNIINVIKRRIYLYEELRKLPEETRNILEIKPESQKTIPRDLKLSIFDDEFLKICHNIQDLEDYIKPYEESIESIKKDLPDKQKLINEAKEKYQSAKKDLEKMKHVFEESKGKLIPLFDELKAFYLKHGIK